MFVNSQKILNLLEQLAPKKYAESWDNVGLLLGNDEVQIDKVMVVLDITEPVVEEAIEKNIDLIISHHPLIFKGMKNITERTHKGRMIRRLIKHDIHVYAAHTNLDIAHNGLNDYLASLLKLEDISLLEVSGSEAYYQLLTHVPLDNVTVVEEALFKAGAGKVGNYSECDFKIQGEGTFRPLEGANPSIGQVGERESIDEMRLEMLVSSQKLNHCIKALLKAHRYETPSYAVFRMENLETPYGLGRVGRYSKPVSGEAFLSHLKSVLGSSLLKVAGQLPDEIKKVGLCTGAGSEFIHAAKRKGCHVYITGDVKYHEAQLADELGICIIDAGHYETENIYMAYLRDYLEEKCRDKNYEIKLINSESLENPFKIY